MAVVSKWRAANWRSVLMVDRPLFVGSNALVLHNLRRLQLRVGPGARVVTYWAGIPAYFSAYRLVDALGYSDRTIAHRPPRPEITWREYVPGHSKSAPRYLLSRRPDAFFQFWDLGRLPVPDPEQYMAGLGYARIGEFWVLRESRYLLPGALDPPGPLDPPPPPRE